MYPQIVHVPLVFHFHQPVGQFHYVFEEAYEKSYFPLINYLFQFPQVKANLHFSGPLLEWLDTNHRDFFDELLIPMIIRDQIEIMTGGYYEPVLVSIADDDKKAQIEKLNNFWKQKIPEIEINGLWLTERIWEPSLVRPLAENGIKYVLIDDENFNLNTFTENSSFYPVITEDQGFNLKTLAINEQIRYLIPWQPVQKTYDFLRQVRDTTDPNSIFKPNVLIFSDAEKMGMWPAGGRSTYDICYKTGFNNKPWIQELFEMLSETEWISSCTIKEYLNLYKNYSLPVMYFNSGSYDKMGVWVLESSKRRVIEKIKKDIRTGEAQKQYMEMKNFLKGTHWRSFLAKYPESNYLHKFMNFLRSIYSNIEEKGPEFSKNETIQKGYNYILQAQSNDVYWHGQFGGIYFRFMREFGYSVLIKALNCFESEYKNQFNKNLIEPIFNTSVLANGTVDVILNSEKLVVFISIADGGSIYFILDKQKYYNYSNVFTRIIESYHPDTGDLKKGIVNDMLKRKSFRDYVFLEQPKLSEFYENKLNLDSYFHELPYEILQTNQQKNVLILKCVSKIKGNVISIEKSFEVVNNSKEIKIIYKVINLSDQEVKIYLVPEINIILGGSDQDIILHLNGRRERKYDLKKNYSFSSVKDISIFNSEADYGFLLETNLEIPLYLYTIFTYEISESSYRSSYQGHCLLPVIECKSNIEFNFSLKIR